MNQNLSLTLIVLLLAPLAAIQAAETLRPPAKPNVVVIMTDEHNAGVMGCAGDRLARTPHLDALAARGVLFSAHYCASPICVPSRQSFTTGKYVSRHNVWGNTAGVREGTPSLPRLLNAAGYESFLVGKMHYKGGYVLSGDQAMLEALLKRLDVLLKWPTNDLLGSQVLTALAGLRRAARRTAAGSPETHAGRDRETVATGLAAWPGNIEGRQVENHFWQVELSGNFTAALATVHDLEASREMLEYTYELFLARFPNLATPDGGWAEGLGYFGVNKSAVVDMALLLKKVGHVDVFQKEWYRSLAGLLHLLRADRRPHGRLWRHARPRRQRQHRRRR